MCVPLTAPIDRFKRTATFFASSVVEKGTAPLLPGTARRALRHKRWVCPLFPFRALLRERCSYFCDEPIRLIYPATVAAPRARSHV